jgi:aspartate/methionine/tyrosine aminotransferase
MERMPTRVSARVSAISESATLAVDAKAKALKAAGRPVIGFGAGEPDFPTPGYIVEAAQRACAEPRFHKYTPAAGLPELRQAIAAKTARDSGYQVEAGQVLVTNGGKQAVYQTFATLLDPGDEVIVPAPYWTTYPESIALAGGVMVPVLTGEDAGYLATVDQLEAARTSRTKVVLFVSPSNPTGAVYPPRRCGRSASGLRRTACGWSPTRSMSTWSTAARRSPRSRSRRRPPRTPAWC